MAQLFLSTDDAACTERQRTTENERWDFLDRVLACNASDLRISSTQNADLETKSSTTSGAQTCTTNDTLDVAPLSPSTACTTSRSDAMLLDSEPPPPTADLGGELASRSTDCVGDQALDVPRAFESIEEELEHRVNEARFAQSDGLTTHPSEDIESNRECDPATNTGQDCDQDAEKKSDSTGKSEKLSLEERRRNRVLRNRESARRSAQKKKQYLDQMEQCVNDLTRKNQELTQLLAKKRKMLDELFQRLDSGAFGNDLDVGMLNLLFEKE